MKIWETRERDQFFQQEYNIGDEKLRHNENYENSINPKYNKTSQRKSYSRSSSASSSSSVQSISKERIKINDLEKDDEKYKEFDISNTKGESSDSRQKQISKSEKNLHDQRRRSRSNERTRISKSYDKNSSRRVKRSRSRSKDRRSRSADRKKRSRSRDRRSRSRDRRSRSRDRRSRSKDGKSRRSRSHSRERYRRSRSHDRDRRRSSRYDRRRSRSRSRGKPRDFKEKALSNLRAVLEKTVKLDGEGFTLDASSLEKPSNLPLNVTASSVMTPQIVLQQAMAAMNAKAQALTGISLPKYYNPAAVNPLKYAEQVQKRKLLWQANKEKTEQAKPTSASLWENLTFAQDQDGKMTAKFRKLMGIKAEGTSETNIQEEEKPVNQPDDVVKKQEALFRDLDQQYEMARMSTHTHRGVGLGYTSHTSNIYPTVPK